MTKTRLNIHYIHNHIIRIEIIVIAVLKIASIITEFEEMFGSNNEIES